MILFGALCANRSVAAAWQIVDWYRQRWIIEQFFRTLKLQGLRIEDSQLTTADRLLNLVAIAAIDLRAGSTSARGFDGYRQRDIHNSTGRATTTI